jgi:two-component system OmpR family response regulator
MRVLVVEDDERTADLLARGLREARHRVDVVGTGEAACADITTAPYEAVLLDVMLPGIDGLETCRRMRADAIPTPILLLTARGEVEDRVAGLDAGADDYVTKPFFLEEILARLRAFDRRPTQSSDGVLRAGRLWFDPAALEAGHGSTTIPLSPRQAGVLEVFLTHPRQVLTREAIVEWAWDGAYDLHSNVVDVHVSALRRKLEAAGAPTIETVRGLGYRLAIARP